MEGSFAIRSLRDCALFRDAGDPALAQVVGRLRQRRFRRNEVIFHQGDPGDSLHIVVDGVQESASANGSVLVDELHRLSTTED